MVGVVSRHHRVAETFHLRFIRNIAVVGRNHATLRSFLFTEGPGFWKVVIEYVASGYVTTLRNQLTGQRPPHTSTATCDYRKLAPKIFHSERVRY